MWFNFSLLPKGLYIAVYLWLPCRIYEELGNGNFGMVHRGLWTSSKHNFEVALKCLLTSSTEGERIKFFQEAAIMGQFIHPNILKILGMVTISEPVRNLNLYVDNYKL